MKPFFAALALCVSALPVSAQQFAEANSGVIRWLDRLTGETGDVEIGQGQAVTNGRLTIQLDACRYPSDNPAAEAEAFLTIVDSSRKDPVFSGWMLASSPALSALEHPRFDVWVLRCVVEGYKPPVAQESEPTEAPSDDAFVE